MQKAQYLVLSNLSFFNVLYSFLLPNPKNFMLFAHHFHSRHYISTSYRFLSVWFIYNVLSFSLDGYYPGVPAQRRRHPYHVSDTCISLQEVGDRQGRLGAQDVWWLFSLRFAAFPIDTSHREAPTPIKTLRTHHWLYPMPAFISYLVSRSSIKKFNIFTHCLCRKVVPALFTFCVWILN